MSLESLISELTAALNANTSTLRAMRLRRDSARNVHDRHMICAPMKPRNSLR